MKQTLRMLAVALVSWQWNIQSAIAYDFATLTTSSVAIQEQMESVLSRELWHEYYSRRNNHMPRIVLVPGILGSRLIEGNSGEIIWGELSFKRRKSLQSSIKYSPTQNIRPALLKAFKTPAMDIDVYGEGASKILSEYLSDQDFLKPFPYDWRQDNRISANEFHKWLCENHELYRDRTVIVVAHSMGGLLTKYWTKYHYAKNAPCSDGHTLNFRSLKIYFVGVPHYGAPKAIAAFARGFGLLEKRHEIPVFGMLFRYVDEKILRQLNDYAYTFPSIYQMLPIFNDNCFRQNLGVEDVKRINNPIVA